MKTFTSSKKLKFDLDSDHDLYLEINISTTGNVTTSVSLDENTSFKYEGRVKIGTYEQFKNKIIIIDHIFSFSNIDTDNVESAMHQTKITYNLVSVIGPVKPLKNKTPEDLIDDKIGVSKIIKIQ
ncbi:hypothetical protein QF023_002495 [Chryseobacterium sp. SLBN-27]|jgi:hypothetical protein|uniref:hypothetical protein n=1 Tax=Chryseobacterium sp. SLBN-27 TaxID=3042287 RepID=UPI002866E2BC|nr:hypothetical protein [Chryseobacterium sp. SLBN-27]MDR6158979.1 hypothetical protein [Chryseobacterium sp. SLBN-27]